MSSTCSVVWMEIRIRSAFSDKQIALVPTSSTMSPIHKLLRRKVGSEMRLIRTAMIVALAACLAPVEAQQADTFRLEFERMMSSPLYQQARNAGGQISKVRDADPAKLYPDLASLFKASDLV